MVTMHKIQANSTTQHGGYKKIVFLICTIASLGGLLFGLDQGFIANSLPSLEDVYRLSVSEGENYAASLASGAIIGALLSGFFARYLGRKKSLILGGFLFSALSIISATLPSISILTACRFGLGFAVGLASFIVPLYLSETAPTRIRGSMGTLFQLMICIGIFIIAVSNVAIVKIFVNPQVSLPLMFMVVGIFALLMFIGSLKLPESPRWLILKGKKSQAVEVLNQILTNQQDIDSEIKEIEETILEANGVNFGGVLKGYFIKILLVGIILQMFQQLVGINLMIYYSPVIFGYAGITGIVAGLIVPTVIMLFTFPAINLVERWGRKKLLYIGSIIMFCSLVVAGIAFMSIDPTTSATQIGFIPKFALFTAVIVYIFGFAFSWGPVAWLICSEVFPLKIREVGMTVTTMVNWTFAGLVMGNALTFMQKYGNSEIFFVFAGFCLLSILFLKLFVPETRNITLEEIEHKLKSGIALKDLGKNTHNT